MSSFLTLCVLLLVIGFGIVGGHPVFGGAMIWFSLAGIFFSVPYLIFKRLFFR